MDANKILFCPKCNLKFKDKILRLSCMHSICENCLDAEKKESVTKCNLCNTSTSYNDIIRNTFLEMMSRIEIISDQLVNQAKNCDICDPEDENCIAYKYCVDCSQYLCNKCLKLHNRMKLNINHQVFDADNIDKIISKSKDPKCEKHDQDMKIYCNECDELICSVCCVMGHANHSKDDNIKEHFIILKLTLQQKIDDIDRILKSQETIIHENDVNQTEFVEKVKNIQDEILSQAVCLVDIIEKIYNELINKLLEAKDTFLEEYSIKSKEINDYKLSLNHHKLNVKNILENGTNFDLLNLKKDMTKTSWIELNQPKSIPPKHITLRKPLIDVKSLQSADLLGTIRIINMNDGTINGDNKRPYSVKSICSIEQDLYLLNSYYLKDRIDVYDTLSCQFKPLIDLKNYIPDIQESYQIITICNFLFIFCAIKKRTFTENVIYKFDLKNNICLKWKMMHTGYLSSTTKNTILVATYRDEVIEFSIDGHPLKYVRIPINALSMPISYIYSTRIYQLINEGYVCAKSNGEAVVISLLNSKGSFINSLTIKCLDWNFSICTDCDKYIFVYESNKDIISVLSMELHKIHEFDHIPDILEIFYDQVNTRLLVSTMNKILYINVNLKV